MDRARERACPRRLALSRGFTGMETIGRFIRDTRGQDVVEYGVLNAAIAIVVDRGGCLR
jgi:hypothetical protein